jgi:DMSO/TMAO reductase YedYZ molybdopterin-dependent catalytic subunit
VTTWSTFDNRWEGVPFREILKRVQPKPEARHVMALGHVGPARYGYSTNVPLADLDREDVLFAYRHNGRDLEPDHGGPLRLVVPRLYAWKSAKWARGLIFMDEDKAGYWSGSATTCTAIRSGSSVSQGSEPYLSSSSSQRNGLAESDA